MASEHSISAEGSAQPIENDDLAYDSTSTQCPPDNSLKAQRRDQTGVFFSSNEENRYTPRSILIDLEPSVICKSVAAMPMFNTRNVHLSDNGSGAANNWQSGHKYAARHEDELVTLIDRELDKCDNLLTFQLFHSVAGGTGSGVGSYLLELLDDRYGSKKLVTTFSIFPSNERTSDVVVQPYNTVLTLQRLIDHSNATFVFDNDSLGRLDSTFFSGHDASRTSAFEGENRLISYIACGMSNPLRFPSYIYSSYESLLATLVPTPDLKFLSSAIAPFSYIPGALPHSNYVNLNEVDIVLELLNDKYKMNQIHESHKYITMLDYVIGDKINQVELRKGLVRAQQRALFVPWASSVINVVNGKKPYGQPRAALSGFQVSSNTSIQHMFHKIVRQYELLAKRAAYINYYTDTNDPSERAQVLDTFNECKELIMRVLDEYRWSCTLEYLEIEQLDKEMG
ncbi:tubulin-domain-containing protein [Metschnikowia bicuspidata]|uniref:Tubulin gamma chain n=1 Tax=Metschnikowia bicuspidata TaxID=27322 RepID=A0A4V1J2M3_9ASCO|nr:tubulin-domain-containing protein [Metschnikowia bicuspidata]